MDLGLQGKKALVTASTRGLGRAVATKLAMEGAHVAVCGRNSDVVDQLVRELKERGAEANGYTVDLEHTGELDKLIDQVKEDLGTVDILVNNSGGPKAGELLDLTLEDWQTSFQLNLLSMVHLTASFLPGMMKSGGGRIMNIASSSIVQPIPNLLLSNTFRTGILGFTKSIATAYGKYGIIANVIAPGRIATDRVKDMDQVRARGKQISYEEQVKLTEQEIPLGRYGTPEEFAEAVAYFVSERNTYMTGISVMFDGGIVKAIS
ncbi:SDR family oxidoreductase [Paenibacillus piri]|uniref:SDR family oxidoreductase n=1 Tax=Paenibacillus piri TaxID=2547395 RepID=A0A4R5K9H1_9BACL|nr:SDR family oxidoreductase [Paenibacillus piri]TDF89731.1 SDR family oxidoreductase [Paenibacillus piri]